MSRALVASFVVALTLVRPGLTAGAVLIARQNAPAPALRGVVVDISGASRRVVRGLGVRLEVMRAGRTVVVARGRTDAQGRFNLPIQGVNDGAFRVVADYRGVAYSAPLTRSVLARTLTLPVYDTTSGDASVIAPSVLVGVRPTARGLTVVEQWTLVNAGNRTIIGAATQSGRGAARIPLPTGARNVVVRDALPQPATASVDVSAVTLNAVLRPATGMNAASFHQITYSFTLDGRGRWTLPVPTRYFVGSLKVFGVGAALVAPQFKRITLQNGAQRLSAWEDEALRPGTTAYVGVGGPPLIPGQLAPPGFPTALVVGFGAAGFGLLLLLGVAGLSMRRDDARRKARLGQERADLIRAVAHLDLAHERGQVGADAYVQSRERAIERLLRLERRLDS